MNSPGFLFEEKDGGLLCKACRRRCFIAEGKSGFCGQRKNISSKPVYPRGLISCAALDPIEKKPFYHVLPKSVTFSYGGFGCNFSCLYCQNHCISKPSGYVEKISITAERLIDSAVSEKTSILVSTYNEPTVSAEWNAEIFSMAVKKIKNLKIGLVSNGYFTEETLSLWDRIDFINIDLKSFNSDTHKKLTGAHLEGVIKSIELCIKKGIWIELTTLIVEGINDSEKEISEAASFIRSLSCEIPWHITAYRPAYLMSLPPTRPAALSRAISIARQAGLRHVYGGNVSGENFGDTFCPSCSRKVCERKNYLEIKNLMSGGKCPYCGYLLKGVWE